jgi:hypothetical protein
MIDHRREGIELNLSGVQRKASRVSIEYRQNTNHPVEDPASPPY